MFILLITVHELKIKKTSQNLKRIRLWAILNYIWIKSKIIRISILVHCEWLWLNNNKFEHWSTWLIKIIKQLSLLWKKY